MAGGLGAARPRRAPITRRPTVIFWVILAVPPSVAVWAAIIYAIFT